jgi:hypothetical protein
VFGADPGKAIGDGKRHTHVAGLYQNVDTAFVKVADQFFKIEFPNDGRMILRHSGPLVQLTRWHWTSRAQLRGSCQLIGVTPQPQRPRRPLRFDRADVESIKAENVVTCGWVVEPHEKRLDANAPAETKAEKGCGTTAAQFLSLIVQANMSICRSGRSTQSKTPSDAKAIRTIADGTGTRRRRFTSSPACQITIFASCPIPLAIGLSKPFGVLCAWATGQAPHGSV